MTDLICPRCGPKWSGAYNSDHQCVTCGTGLIAREPWRERCQCTFAQRMTGDGCDVCNPEMAAEIEAEQAGGEA